MRRGKSKSPVNKVVFVHRRDFSVSNKNISSEKGMIYLNKLQAI